MAKQDDVEGISPPPLVLLVGPNFSNKLFAFSFSVEAVFHGLIRCWLAGPSIVALYVSVKVVLVNVWYRGAKEMIYWILLFLQDDCGL